MDTGVILWTAAALLALFIAIGLAWRCAALPCPSWLIPLLENPYFEAVAGAERLLGRAGIGPGMQVLDAGCGPGRLTLPAADRVGPAGAVVALDIQPRMLAELERRRRRLGAGNIETIQAGLGEGRLPSARFDRAFLVAVLGEVPDRPAALREIRRSLKPGGILSITEVLPDPHYQRLSKLRSLAGRVGFREVGVFRGLLAYTANFERADGPAEPPDPNLRS